MVKKIKITSAKQFQTLISELEKNPVLAKGFHRGITPHNFKQDWDNLAIKLNSIGPPIRDSEGWQKVWRDFKFKVKKKLQRSGTDDGKIKQATLHPLEEAVANLLQFQNQLNTDDESVSQSAVNIKTEDFYVVEEMDFQSTVANAFQEQEFGNSSRKKRKRRKSEERPEFLEKLFNEISYTMVEVRNVLKVTNSYQQKLCEVEDKKLKIMKRRHEREEQLFEAEMKLKNIKIELKTKELEILEKQCSN